MGSKARKAKTKTKTKLGAEASALDRVKEHLRLTAQAIALVEQSQKHLDRGQITEAHRALAAAERLLKKRNALGLRPAKQPA
jgi:hypothetical protein